MNKRKIESTSTPEAEMPPGKKRKQQQPSKATAPPADAIPENFVSNRMNELYLKTTRNNNANRSKTNTANSATAEEATTPFSPKPESSTAATPTATQKDVFRKQLKVLQKKKKQRDTAFLFKELPTERFSKLGGMNDIIQQVEKKIMTPFKFPKLFKHLGSAPSSGILLQGPPGCGKTCMVHALIGELGLWGVNIHFFKVPCTELVTGVSGDSEKKLRGIFDEAKANSPAILFFDQIDVLFARQQEYGTDMMQRIQSQFYQCFDDLTRDNEAYFMQPEKKPEEEITLNNQTPSATPSNDQTTTTITTTEEEDVKMKDVSEQEKPKEKDTENAAIDAENAGPDADSASLDPSKSKPQQQGFVLVIGATNRIDLIDDRARQSERFGSEIIFKIPDFESRIEIIKVLTQQPLKLEPNFPFEKLAKFTPGFVGRDLKAVVKEATEVASERIKKKYYDLVAASYQASASSTSASTYETEKKFQATDFSDDDCLKFEDFELGLKNIKPVAIREGYCSIPDVSWEDIGGLENVVQELEDVIINPVKFEELYKNMNCFSKGDGVLLYGPPGCGKTLLAKAVAKTNGFNFISIKGPELLNKYVGESESNVRRIFERARTTAPCILFFDELDALCPERKGGSDGGGNQVTERVVNQLLTEMDGVQQQNNVFIIGATNRPDIIDKAILRPGRLSKKVCVPLPDSKARADILKRICARHPVDWESIDIEGLAGKDTEGFSGADLAALVKEAARIALKEILAVIQDHTNKNQDVKKRMGTFEGMDVLKSRNEKPLITSKHFEAAKMKITPSVSKKDNKIFEKMN